MESSPARPCPSSLGLVSWRLRLVFPVLLQALQDQPRRCLASLNHYDGEKFRSQDGLRAADRV